MKSADSPRRQTVPPAIAPPLSPPPHESLAPRSSGETAQSPPIFFSRSPRSAHSPAPPRLFPAAAAASDPMPQHSPPGIPSTQPLRVSSPYPPNSLRILSRFAHSL